MAYATDAERVELKNSSDFGVDFVVRIKKGERESELVADDLDHALYLNFSWINNHGAEYVEIFRVNDDGSLAPTIGAYRKEAA